MLLELLELLSLLLVASVAIASSDRQPSVHSVGLTQWHAGGEAKLVSDPDPATSTGVVDEQEAEWLGTPGQCLQAGVLGHLEEVLTTAGPI